MLNLYSGTPGSGKSLDVAKLIYRWIRKYKCNVICVNMSVYRDFIYQEHRNFKINDFTERLFGKRFLKDSIPRSDRGVLYTLHDFDNISPKFFYDYALKFHKRGKEHQTLIVIDEAQMFFNPTIVKEHNTLSQECKRRHLPFKLAERSKYYYEDTYRNDWLKFFTQHRHLGFDIILVSQFDKLIDSQVRCLFEYNYIHRKINNYSFGMILSFLGLSAFLKVQHWYGAKLRCGAEMFFYSKKYAKVYNSYRLYDEIFNKLEKKSDAKAEAQLCEALASD